MKQRHFKGHGAFRFKRFARKAYSAFNSMHRVVNMGVVTGCALICLPSGTVSAQKSAESGEQQKVMEKELDEVMVTASRVELPINQTAKLVTIISKEQIAQAPVRSIQDLLIYAANVDVVQRGGHGVQADISLRGGTFDQTTILLNGVNLSNPHTGHYSFDFPVNLSDIERIEIIHGPSALIFGAGAFSGGINIITKKNIDYKAYANVEAGMHKLRGIEVRGTAKTGLANHSLSVGYNSSDGYIHNSDYDIYNVLWQTRFRFGGESKMDLQLGYNDKQYGATTFYSALSNDQYERTSTYMGSLKGEFGSKLKIVPIIYWNRHHDQYDWIKDTEAGRNFHRNDTYGANLIFAYKSKLGTTSLGGELRREDIMSTNLGLVMAEPHRKYTKYDDRTNTSVSLEHTAGITDKLVVSAGVLMNHNTLLDGKYRFYPSVSVTYRPDNSFSVSSSWSKSTRMPTFVDLYYKAPTHNAKNDLKPENSESLELGLKYRKSFFKAYLTGFLQWGRNMIDWVKEDPASVVYTSWNHSKINTQGVEMGAEFLLGDILPVLGEQSLLAIDYTRMHQDSDTRNMISLYSLNYLRDKFTTRFHHRIYKDFSASWYFRFQKRMGTYEKYEDKVKIGDVGFPSFSTLDLKLDYKYNDMSFYLNLNNLYDTHYFDKGNIPQPGFWLMGGLSYTFR
ncbi:TonB-dependent siderophore receptor [Dysgonomonas sp. 511]|uniref:TonB-dependent receptor plug domain-containing protein n=1 Tax=Dysgonomonas sp. 511 TaxID=2302930 RepID=UPI0013D3A42D|nr:TonB-dependent receptor [Dysgonomonas sp. 511]NDV79363.1 TonB-dependent receptor [Dysgonomonas sp. 511]